MEQKKVTGISKYLPAFGVKGWGIALMGMAFYYFYQGPLHFAINFYYGYFEALYGWTNSQLAAAITIGQLVGVAGIFIWGPLNKSWGSKKVAIIGLVGGAISTMFFAFAPSIPTFYLSVILFCFFAVAYSQIAVATLCTGTFMAAMSAFSNVTVSMVTNVFGRQDFENAWPVVSVPFKIIESFGVLLISMIAAASSFTGSYIAMIALLIVAIVLMLMTTTKQIGSQIHGTA